MVIKSNDKNLSPFSNPADQKRSSLRQALPQILAVCVKNVLLLGFGMTLGFPTILIPSLSGNNPNETFSLGQEAISWIGSINLICVPVGCLLSGAITQPVGRKRAMQFVNIPFLAAWLLFHFSTDVWQVFLALAITGITGGLLEAPTLTYVAEITHPKLRGTLATTSAIAVVGGVLIQFIFGTFLTWRTTALVNCVFPVISFILLFLVPESPHWLISKNRLSEAQESLAWLRGWATFDDIQLEFDELCEQIKNDETSSQSLIKTMKLFTQKSFLWPFLLVCFTFFLNHFTGTTTLQVYAVKIFSTMHSPINRYYATLLMGIAEITGCIMSTCLVYYFGKRLINFISLIGCGLCFFTVALYAFLENITYLKLDNNNTDLSETYDWIPTTLLITAAFFAYSGIKILPWLLLGEVFFTEVRAMGSGFAGAVSYIFSFIANKIFLSMISLMTISGTFWFYSLVSFIGTIILYFVLPETEGKSLFEITEHFASNSKLSNKVKRYKKKKQSGEVNESYIEENDKY